MSHPTTPRVSSIPTTYGGHRMDSRLETAWAAFFDEHGVVWDYHPECYRLGRVHYEPDFWLPAIRTIVEVKGAFTGQRDFKPLTFALQAARNDVLIVYGEAPAGIVFSLVHPTPLEVAYPGASGKAAGPLIDKDLFIGRCAECDTVQFVERCMAWDCRVCGHYDGAGTYKDVVYSAGGR